MASVVPQNRRVRLAGLVGVESLADASCASVAGVQLAAGRVVLSIRDTGLRLASHPTRLGPQDEGGGNQRGGATVSFTKCPMNRAGQNSRLAPPMFRGRFSRGIASSLACLWARRISLECLGHLTCNRLARRCQSVLQEPTPGHPDLLLWGRSGASIARSTPRSGRLACHRS